MLDQLREKQQQGKYGIDFEKLMVIFLSTAPTLAEQFDEVYRWADWRYNAGIPDRGIDIVALRVDDDSWVAVQAKFYMPTTTIQKAHIDSFSRHRDIPSTRRRARSIFRTATLSRPRTSG
ncbi:hypothetical protein [Corynebacterium mayonis]|uniref:restriction endonuclease n=1 Tax=Corynebacterium mayonis TaxID=3062461 RepID=UPI0031406D3A